MVLRLIVGGRFRIKTSSNNEINPTNSAAWTLKMCDVAQGRRTAGTSWCFMNVLTLHDGGRSKQDYCTMSYQIVSGQLNLGVSISLVIHLLIICSDLRLTSYNRVTRKFSKNVQVFENSLCWSNCESQSGCWIRFLFGKKVSIFWPQHWALRDRGLLSVIIKRQVVRTSSLPTFL